MKTPLVVKMFLFPSYVELDSVRYFSKKLFEILDGMGVEVVAEHWSGSLDSIPTGEPALVRASTKQECSDDDLAKFCRDNGHLSFYDDRYHQPDGRYTSEGWEEVVRDFLKRVEKSAMPTDKVIPYLRSESKDRSTLGRGTHQRRKAEVLLRLFKAYVLNDDIVPVDRSVFNTAYTLIEKMGSTDVGESLRMDVQTFETLRGEIQADKEMLEALGLTALAKDPRAKAYRMKLGRALEHGLRVLTRSTESTGEMYEANASPLDAAVRGINPHPANVLVQTFASRRMTDSTSQVMDILRSVALPLLVEKLVAAGYPDSSEVIEWEYS